MVEKSRFLPMQKQRPFNTFVFASRVVQSLIFLNPNFNLLSFLLNPKFSASSLFLRQYSSGGFRGGSRSSLEHPLGPNYFIFMGNLKRFCVELGKRTPFLHLNPLFRNPRSAPVQAGLCKTWLEILKTGFIAHSSFHSCLFMLVYK